MEAAADDEQWDQVDAALPQLHTLLDHFSRP